MDTPLKQEGTTEDLETIELAEGHTGDASTEVGKEEKQDIEHCENDTRIMQHEDPMGLDRDEDQNHVQVSLDDDDKKTENAEADRQAELEGLKKIKFIRGAIIISWITIVLTLATGIGGLAVSLSLKSIAMLSFSLESFVDSVSSIFVLWRFWRGDDKSDPIRKQILERREKRASVGIALTLVLTAIAVGIQAIYHLSKHQKPEEAHILIYIAIASIVCFTILAIFKFRIAHVLSSAAMKKDAVSSLSVAVLCAGIVVSASVFTAHPSIWYLDAVTAIVVSLALLIYGMRTLVRNRRCGKSEFWRGKLSGKGVLIPNEEADIELRVIPTGEIDNGEKDGKINGK